MSQYKMEVEPQLQVRSMATARSGVAAAALDGLLYVVGGWDGTRRLRTGEVPSKVQLVETISNNAQVYNPRINQWSSLPQMVTPR